MAFKYVPPEEEKEPEKPKAPAKPDIEVFRSPGGGTTGFTDPKGQTFLGPISKEEEAGIKQRFAPEQARLSERERLIQQEQSERLVSETEIPIARPIGDTTIGAFAEADIHPKRSLFQKLAENPLGQAFIGDVAFEKIRDNPKTASAILDMTNFMIENGLTPQQVSDDPATQMILSLKLNELDIKLIKSGKSDVNSLEIAIEALPLGKYIGKVGAATIGVTVPSQKISDLEGQIEQIGNSIRDWRMAAARSPTKANDYLALIEDAEISIRNAESRIKLLIIQSPALQNAPEEVETIQRKINRHLNRVGDARNAILGGETLEQFMNLSGMNV